MLRKEDSTERGCFSEEEEEEEEGVKKYTDNVYYPEEVAWEGVGGGVAGRLRSGLNDEIL